MIKYCWLFSFFLLLNTNLSQAQIKFLLLGDVLLGSDSYGQKYVPPNKSDLTAWSEIHKGSDILIGNYEGNFCNQGVAKKCEWQKPCYAFKVSTSETKFLKDLGFSFVSIANNHTLDFEETCRISTINALRENRISTSGLPDQIARIRIDEKNISFIAFHASQHFNSTLDLKKSITLVHQERKIADIILIYFHGGAEGPEAAHITFKPEFFVGENRGDVVKFSRSMIEAGADLVFGSGPHVVRGCEVYKNKLIAYSLGDAIFPISRDQKSYSPYSLGLKILIDPKDSMINYQFLSLNLKKNGWPQLDPNETALKEMYSLSIKDFGKGECAH